MTLNDILPLVNQKAANAAALGNTIRFDLGDDCVHVDGTGGSNVVSTEKKDADCTVTVSHEVFHQLLTGDLNPMAAVMSGQVKIGGDMSVAMKLPAIFNS
jgi:putative sterol carrier protein